MTPVLEPKWQYLTGLGSTVLITYLALLLLISIYGLHRYWLVFLFCLHSKRQARPAGCFNMLPSVTVQLPMYNEGPVARRIIDAACNIDYPADKIQIQVLDDSTDDSQEIARQCCQSWSARGVNIQYLHRATRAGYKAGALRDATPLATGEFIAMFDADFLPPSRFLQEVIHYFTDPQVGMVQTRWTHLNRTDSLLTRCQALFLDGHFVIEHTARYWSGRWVHFNGTAGIWRRQTIQSAGGWHHDTLTEDLDLSYRGQLAGWRYVYLSDVTCPAELPPEINAFKTQQHRWTKGSIQAAVKLLPRLLLASAPLRAKIEAFFHLTCPMVYLFVTLLILLLLPMLVINRHRFEHLTLAATLLTAMCMTFGTTSVAVFTLTSQYAQRRSVLGTLAQLPLMMSLGIGISVNNAVACIEALIGYRSPFVRTPKYNVQTGTKAPSFSSTIGAIKPEMPMSSFKVGMALFEIVMGLYVLACIYLAAQQKNSVISVPFLVLFACGYFYVGFNSLFLYWQSRRMARQWLPQPS